MLELRNITRHQAEEVFVDDISLCMQRGELNILLGPTLAGKTSLMRIMAGLDKPDSGELLFDGVSVLGMAVQKRNVAMVYQQFINYPHLTVYENVAFPLKQRGTQKAEIHNRVMNALSQVGLEGFQSRKIQALSGGQQQRVALARSLVKEAKILLLDEPLVNLDYKLR